VGRSAKPLPRSEEVSARGEGTGVQDRRYPDRRPGLQRAFVLCDLVQWVIPAFLGAPWYFPTGDRKGIEHQL
jgi:hypothetical protein